MVEARLVPSRNGKNKYIYLFIPKNKIIKDRFYVKTIIDKRTARTLAYYLMEYAEEIERGD